MICAMRPVDEIEQEVRAMLKCIPFILFDGNCAEAMKFYHSCLGGELTLTRLGDTPMKSQFPAEKHQRIINANLKSGALEFSATDWMAAPEYLPTQGDTFSIFVIGDAYGELKGVFDRLSVGAQVSRFQSLHEMPFGTYGQFTDRYGVRWIFKGDSAEGR
jgi:PhnB protein